MKILNQVYQKIIDTIGQAPIESGGIIGVRDGTICAYYFDEGNSSPTEYKPDTQKINSVIQTWAKERIAFAGIVHSHPNGLKLLSKGDEEYARNILNDTKLEKLIFPIVTIESGVAEITFYEISNKIGSQKIKIVKS